MVRATAIAFTPLNPPLVKGGTISSSTHLGKRARDGLGTRDDQRSPLEVEAPARFSHLVTRFFLKAVKPHRPQASDRTLAPPG